MDLHMLDNKGQKVKKKVSLGCDDLIEYKPEKSCNSKILNDMQISSLIAELPSYLRESRWERIFCIDVDGTSLQTMYERCRDFDTTVLVVQDTQGYVFGGFCTEAWDEMFKFFGNGDNFLFTYGTAMDVKVHCWQGEDDQHMYADKNLIGLAGSKVKGRFALAIRDGFLKGSSVQTSAYGNEVLSKTSDFRIKMFELWALTY